MLLVVVEDMEFASNNQILLHAFKHYLQEHFDVNLYGKLTSFTFWVIVRT